MTHLHKLLWDSWIRNTILVKRQCILFFSNGNVYMQDSNMGAQTFVDGSLANVATLLLVETPAVTQRRHHPVLWTTWVWILLNMFDVWRSHSLPASIWQMTANRSHLGSKSTQERIFMLISWQQELYKGINSPCITLMYHQSGVHCLQSIKMDSRKFVFLMYPNPHCLVQFVISCIYQNDSKHSL